MIRCNQYRFGLLSLLLMVLLVSCASSHISGNPFRITDADEYEKLFSVYNSYQGSVCMGISGPYEDKDKAMIVATGRCLQYLAFFRGLAVQVDFGSIVANGIEEKVTDYSVLGGTSDSIYLETAKDMQIVKSLWFGGKIGAVVFARLPEMKRIRISKNNADSVSGLVTVYATSEKTYSDFSDAIEAATFRAAQSLLAECSSTVNVDNTLIESKSDSFRKDSYSISALRIEGFTVISYEYSIEEDKVYAFVACKQ